MIAKSQVPWIRSLEALKLLSSVPASRIEDPQARLLIGFQADLVRVQARTAHFHCASGEKIRYNWPVPKWVWRLRTGRLLLGEDRFFAVIDEFAPPVEARTEPFVELWKVELFELKIHEAEMVRHLQLEPIAANDAISPRAPGRIDNKVGISDQCANWLKEAFAQDPERRKKKRDFRDDALLHFQDKLNPFGFDQAWRKAIADDPVRAKRGRRPLQ
ncbi:hypothetical protein [Croceicoccus sp. Ery15]|uniref:hypothetical protein n=1 Tax=Croceicoccus sp. Ery15 TaxID=1703338 RepID=UPI001E5A8586|nr:hypothetical protein [Croceicoccus sp. Ery15]